VQPDRAAERLASTEPGLAEASGAAERRRRRIGADQRGDGGEGPERIATGAGVAIADGCDGALELIDPRIGVAPGVTERILVERTEIVVPVEEQRAGRDQEAERELDRRHLIDQVACCGRCPRVSPELSTGAVHAIAKRPSSRSTSDRTPGLKS
jgi:hypothetical protein